MVVLRKSEIEDPSDISGLIYRAYNKNISEIKDKLRKYLKSVGIKIKD